MRWAFPRLCAVLAAMWAIVAGVDVSRADTVASLLGNFTINQFCELAPGGTNVEVHYVVVYGQLPALRELHAADSDGNGVTSQQERDAYVGRLAPSFARDLRVHIDGREIPLRATRWTSSLPTEQGGFSLRIDVDFTGDLTPIPASDVPRTLEFSNQNFAGRMGWHEIVIKPGSGVAVYATNGFDTSATGGLTEALQSLPENGPLDERDVHLQLAPHLPPGAVPLADRPQDQLPTLAPAGNLNAATPMSGLESAWITRKTRELIDAISGPHLPPHVAFWALLAALALGSVHALSPGHGKTIVGAYLIGSRGTPRHAVFLGFTVTVTHTIGVFVLGFATLYASRFIVPERLFPILSLISAVLVLGMGVVLLVQRGIAARRAMTTPTPEMTYVPLEAGAMGARHALMLSQPRMMGGVHDHAHADGTWHSHGGGSYHSHLPPGTAGERVTWRSLLTLGISGGLVPCPSALVLLLAAIALNKTLYGMLLVLVFSVGLAATLTAVGLAFLYARNRFSKPGKGSRWPLLLPVASAATITLVGAALCVAALRAFG